MSVIPISILLLLVLFSVTVETAEISIAQTLVVLSDFLSSTLGFETQNSVSESLRTIINVRLPRIILALSSGASLAVAGSVLQGVFFNPMADPYTMGISFGVACAVAIGIVLWTTNSMTLSFILLLVLSYPCFSYSW